jgi:hypothetical protein
VLGTHNNPISDIAWAPDMGRSFHLIATASREINFKVSLFSYALLHSTPVLASFFFIISLFSSPLALDSHLEAS